MRRKAARNVPLSGYVRYTAANLPKALPGLMETADLAGTGNLKLLFGLLETGNVLSLLGAVYPTETGTAVYGPLKKNRYGHMEQVGGWQSEAMEFTETSSRIKLSNTRAGTESSSSDNMHMAIMSRQGRYECRNAGYGGGRSRRLCGTG